MQLELSERQQHTVAAAMTILAVCVILAAVGGILTLLAIFVGRFSNVLMPLAVAGILAMVFNPMYERLDEKLPTPVALASLFLGILLPVGAFVWFFGALVAEQITEMIEHAPAAWERLSAWAQSRWPQVQELIDRYEITDRLSSAGEDQIGVVTGWLQRLGVTAVSAGAAVARGVGAALGWVVMPVYFVFFLIAKDQSIDRIEDYLPFLKPETREDIGFLVREFVRILVSFFRGQLIIAFLQGLLFATGFSIVGLKYGFVLGLALGFLNVIPYLGSIIGLAIALPLGYFQNGGGLLTVGLVLVVFTIVQMIEGYVLTPKIMGNRTGLHPMVIIVAVFFWGSALGGIMGMILAIPLTAFLVVFWRLAKEKYITELV